MSHTCPVCGSTCMCNGDIDDCCFDFDEDVDACICCADDEEEGFCCDSCGFELTPQEYIEGNGFCEECIHDLID